MRPTKGSRARGCICTSGGREKDPDAKTIPVHCLQTRKETSRQRCGLALDLKGSKGRYSDRLDSKVGLNSSDRCSLDPGLELWTIVDSGLVVTSPRPVHHRSCYLSHFVALCSKQSRSLIYICDLQPSSEENCIFANFFSASGLSVYIECMYTSTPKTVFNGNFNEFAQPLNILRFLSKLRFKFSHQASPNDR